MDLVFVCVDKFILVFREKPLILTNYGVLIWRWLELVIRFANQIALIKQEPF
jgi:hypothetical protein